MKKILTLAITLAIGVSCFAGCAGKKETAHEGVEIQVVSTAAGAKEFNERRVNEWNETVGKEKGIWINFRVTTDSQEIDVLQQNGKLPHIFTGNGNQRRKFAKNGDLMAIEDLPGGKEFLAEYGQTAVEGDNAFGGKTYFIYTAVKTAGLAYNKELFEKAGIVDENGEAKPPKTVSEVVEVAKKLTDKKNGIYGFAFPLKFGISYTLRSPMSSFYDGLTPETSQMYIDLDKLEVDCSNFKEQYQWLFDMEKDGSLFPGAASLDNDTARAYFSSGKVAMIPAVSWDVGVYTSQFVPDFEWGLCEYPSPDGRKLVSHWNERGASSIIGRTAAQKNPEETMEVYKFLNSIDSRVATFEEGIGLPLKKEVIEACDKEKVDPNFLIFASFSEENKRYAKSEAYTMEEEDWPVLFSKAWSGTITLDEAISQYEKNATISLRRSVEKGEYDVERQKKVQRYLAGEDGLDLSMTH